ncbi:SH3 domain-containing protein [Neocallimastix sp. 'constans']
MSSHVEAKFDFEAQDETQLSLKQGDIIQVISRLSSGWWDGICNGNRGWFPSNYVQDIDISVGVFIFISLQLLL